MCIRVCNHKIFERFKVLPLFVLAKMNATVKWSLLVSLLIFSKSMVIGQIYTDTDRPKYLEQFELITDRTIYTVGESINFFAYDISGLNKSALSLSKVVYAELISFDGTVFMQEKLPLLRGKVKGIIEIPEGVLSGVYYLRIYTRFMRNFGPTVYTYLPITVLNYKTDEILQKPINYSPDFYLDTVTKMESMHSSFRLKDSILNTREKQTIFLAAPDESDCIGLAVFVVPEYLYSQTCIKVVPKRPPGQEIKTHFVPETRGVSLSGLLIDNQTKLPVSYQGVNLSFLGALRFSLAVLSDSSGMFLFSLPDAKGKNELLITSTYKNSLSIYVDNDFCSESIKLPYIPLSLNEISRQTITLLIKRSVASQLFDNKVKEPQESTMQNYEIYYDEPSQRIVLSDYISLPRLRDYFYELIPQASVRIENGKSSIHVLGDAADLLVYPPLVLIDNIIVTEIDKLLEVSPKRIERIEILNKPYIKGDLTYGGIVNIFSTAGDLAGMELPKSGLFFNYQLFLEQQGFNYEQYIPENEPIMRNTLYWKVFGSDTDSLSELKFNVGDLPGNYVVQWYGLTPEGTMVTDTAAFRVK